MQIGHLSLRPHCCLLLCSIYVQSGSQKTQHLGLVDLEADEQPTVNRHFGYFPLKYELCRQVVGGSERPTNS